MVLGDSTLESLTPSANAPLECQPRVEVNCNILLIFQRIFLENELENGFLKFKNNLE
jgi:hypothetical protein